MVNANEMGIPADFSSWKVVTFQFPLMLERKKRETCEEIDKKNDTVIENRCGTVWMMERIPFLGCVSFGKLSTLWCHPMIVIFPLTSHILFLNYQTVRVINVAYGATLAQKFMHTCVSTRSWTYPCQDTQRSCWSCGEINRTNSMTVLSLINLLRMCLIQQISWIMFLSTK